MSQVPLEGLASGLESGDEFPLSGEGLLKLMREILARQSQFRFRARGGSMWPVIRNGDIITVAPLDSRPICRGDVVAFGMAGLTQPVVHRVVAVSMRYIQTRGDSTLRPDRPVELAAVLGRVVNIERNGRKVSVGGRFSDRIISFAARSPSLSPSLRHLRRIRSRLIRRITA